MGTKSILTTLHNVSLEDDDAGEVEGMFMNGKLLHWWSGNDANWRNEYFEPLMKELGYTVKHSQDPKLKAILKKDVLRTVEG